MSSDSGITVAPVSGQFGADGSAAIDGRDHGAQSVPEGYYLVSLTTTVGQSIEKIGRSLLCVAGYEPGES